LSGRWTAGAGTTARPPKYRIDATIRRNARRAANVDGHTSGPILMSQLAAERPARGSNKPSLGGLIKSRLVYALLSAIPPSKGAAPPIARPAGAAGAAQSDQTSRRSADLKQKGSAAQDGRGDMPGPRGRFHGPVGKTFCGAHTRASGMITVIGNICDRCRSR
jgi:hypothetical protein